MNILIVDDDKEDGELLYGAVKELVPRADCRVVTSAQAARELVEQFKPKFVFLDAVMYPTGGKEILIEFARLPQLQQTKFIVISGLILPEQHAEFTALGANFVMTKPSTYDSLHRFAQHILAPSIVNIRVKLLTNDNLVHDQTSMLEEKLKRNIDFEIALNVQPARQNIQFMVSQEELNTIKSDLGYNVMYLSGGHWLPNI